MASCEFSGQLVAIDVAARKVRAVIDLSHRRIPRGGVISHGVISHGGAIQHGGVRSDDVRHGTSPHGAGYAEMPHAGTRHGAAEHGDMRHGMTEHGDMRHGAAQYDSMPQDVKLSPDGTVFYVADMARGGVWLVDAAKLRVKDFIRTGAGAHGLYVSRDSRMLYVSNRGAGSVSVVSFTRRRPVATWRIPGGGSPDMGGVSADGRRLWLSGRYDGVVYVFDTGNGRLIRKIKVGAGPHGLAVYPQPGRYSLGHTGIFR